MRIPAALVLTLLPACFEAPEIDLDLCGALCSALELRGASFGDGYADGPAPAPTALGGEQTIEIFEGGVALRSFSVTTATDDVAVIDQDQNRIVVRADTGGTTLQVRGQDGQMIDDAWIDVRPIDRIVLAADSRQVRLFPSEPWEAWTGATVTGVVALEDEGGARLVDEATNISRVRDGAEIVRTEWDSFEVTVPETGADVAVSASRAGAERRDEVLHLAASQQIDEAHLLMQYSYPNLWGVAEWCAHATHGDAALLFVPWEFEISGPAARRDEAVGDNCVAAELVDVGQVTVTATAPGYAPIVATLEVTR